MRFRFYRCSQPCLYLARADWGDGVALAVRAGSGFDLARQDLSVPGQPAQRGVHLPEREGLAATEVGVVITLQFVTVARFPFEQAQEGDRHAHTLREYTERIDRSRRRAAGFG